MPRDKVGSLRPSRHARRSWRSGRRAWCSRHSSSAASRPSSRPIAPPGDKRLNESLSGIGAKGLFTHELEADLARGKVQCCVHSLKDLPTEMSRGLEVVALLPREDPRDVLIVNQIVGAESLAELPPGRGRTSSLAARSSLPPVPISMSSSCAATCRRESRRWTTVTSTQRFLPRRDCTDSAFRSA